jgi:tetratricopeptide (TPR) repeat protein
MRKYLAIGFSIFLAGAAQAAPVAPAHPRPPLQKSDLDTLFAALAKANSAEDAKPIEEQILTYFLGSGSPSVDLLMTHTAAALAAGDKDDAKKILDAVTKVAPDYPEGWHQRGKMLAAAGDDEGAIICLQKTVTLNPRQFAAYAELGSILVSYGDKKDGLTTLRKALALDPHLEGVDQEVVKLSREVEGEKI